MPLFPKIPVNQQGTTAVGGVEIWHFVYGQDPLPANTEREHRDEYYSLAIAVKGIGTMQCDMETISIQPKSILLLKPYQVHSIGTISNGAEAYFISIAPFLIPAFCRNIFENLEISGQCVKLTSADHKNMLKMTDLLYQEFNTSHTYKTAVTTNLLNAILIKVASFILASEQKHDHKRNQAFSITQKFKELISEHSFLYSASFFAEKLHITTSHLNDCVKATTGLSVTQVLQQAMLLEAKRNLYYTNEEVKKIAFELGFEDHTYFSRLFKKLTGETPLSFRNKFRE